MEQTGRKGNLPPVPADCPEERDRREDREKRIREMLKRNQPCTSPSPKAQNKQRGTHFLNTWICTRCNCAFYATAKKSAKCPRCQTVLAAQERQRMLLPNSFHADVISSLYQERGEKRNFREAERDAISNAGINILNGNWTATALEKKKILRSMAQDFYHSQKENVSDDEQAMSAVPNPHRQTKKIVRSLRTKESVSIMPTGAMLATDGPSECTPDQICSSTDEPRWDVQGLL